MFSHFYFSESSHLLHFVLDTTQVFINPGVCACVCVCVSLYTHTCTHYISLHRIISFCGGELSGSFNFFTQYLHDDLQSLKKSSIYFRVIRDTCFPHNIQNSIIPSFILFSASSHRTYCFWGQRVCS